MKLTTIRKMRPISAIQSAVIVLGCFTTILSSQQPVVGQDSTVDIDTLSLREQELLRKEQELLRAMGIATQIEQANSDGPEAPEISYASEEQGGLLDTIKSHPALKTSPRRKVGYDQEAHSSNTDKGLNPGQIRTHYSKDYYDGTTASRINRFIKLDSIHEGIEASNQRGRISSLSDEPESEERVRIKDPLRLAATIRSRSAAIKMGPNAKNTRILTLSREAPVEIDYRKGSWYRIKTSAGVRGWVEGRDLLFNDGINPTSVIHIGGISSNTVN